MIWKINRAILIVLFAMGCLTGPLLLAISIPKQDWVWAAIGLSNLIACPFALYDLWQNK